MILLMITLVLFVSNLGLAQKTTSASPSASSCQPNPCMNGGTCYVSMGRAMCRCRAGYAGLRCERETVCAPRNPCENGGRCFSDYSGGYRCRCLGDFGGRNCSEPNPCQSNPCQNGGTCSSYKTFSSYWRLSCKCPRFHRGRRCEIVSPCKTFKCMNGGRCYSSSNSSVHAIARCFCGTTFWGKHCEKASVCSTERPCKNGGSCYNSFNGNYMCACQTEYRGLNCTEKDPDPCKSNPCQNGGTCGSTKDRSGWRYSCKCPLWYGGSNCEKASVCPTERPCKNGGSCYSTYDGNYRCQCQGEYAGRNCTESDPCKSNPCQNGGTCSRSRVYSEWTLSCRCRKLYTGQRCEKEDPDPCNSNPCQNGGTCVSTKYWSEWRLSCRCPPFLRGSYCEKAIACVEENPCKNGSTCYIDYFGDYRCHCPPKVGGRHCTESDPCSSNPCQNGGTCQSYTFRDSSWYQTCKCPSGYTGRNCENAPCPISYFKCYSDPTPEPGNFDTCRKQVELSIKQRNTCLDRQFKDANEKKICSCSELDFIHILYYYILPLEVIVECLSSIPSGQSISRCDESTKQCAEVVVTLLRNTARLKFCSQTVKTQMEGCTKKLEEGQLPFSGCGAYEYVIKKGIAVVYYYLLLNCYECNFTVAEKCLPSMAEPSSFCKSTEGRNLNKTLDCYSTGLKESCAAGSDRAIKGHSTYLNGIYRKYQEVCSKVSKHIEERAKWGCPTLD